MDRLVVEKEPEVETKVEVETEVLEESKKDESMQLEDQSSKTQYLSSLENITIADFKKQEEEKTLQEFEKEKENLIAKQYEVAVEEEKQVSQNIIEKPNYDLIEENKKLVRLKTRKTEKKKSNKKLASIAIVCGLAVSALISITNCVIIENMNANYVQIEETYKLNLSKYLKNINNLDQAQNGMELIETYPEDLLDAGDIGKKSNWFDRLCNFIGGIFGG